MSLRFDASDSLTRLTNLPTITNFTLIGWSYAVSGSGAALSFGSSTPSANFYAVGHDSSAHLEWFFNGTTTGTSGSTINENIWHHVALTCAGTGANQLLCYLNGVLNITLTGTVGAVAQKLWVGQDVGDDPLNCRMAGVKLYSAVLTEAEIAAEMNTWAPVRTANLIGWYPMTEATVAECITSKSPAPTGAGYDWTANGTLTIEADPPLASPPLTPVYVYPAWRKV